jgi:hypothetical protein
MRKNSEKCRIIADESLHLNGGAGYYNIENAGIPHNLKKKIKHACFVIQACRNLSRLS